MDKKLQDVANVLRKDVLIMTNAAGSGHPTSCLSCAEVFSVIFFDVMKHDIHNSENPDNDEFILSKGHAAPILYASYFRAGVKMNLNGLRKLNSDLEGHPMPKSFPYAKVATGSLGQGLSVGVGFALSARLQGRKFKTYVLLGDSELSEGSVWEAVQLASYYKLNNLVAIVDVNRLGQRGETMLGHDLKSYKKRFESFQWNAEIVDGHDIRSLRKVFSKKFDKPTVILAKTLKGKGVSFLENKQGWHGKALDDRHLGQALNELPHVEMPKINIKKPDKMNGKKFSKLNTRFSKFDFGEMVATRDAYGIALRDLVKSDKNVIALDAEVSDSTRSEFVKDVSKENFLEMFIAEQNMIGVALGLNKKGFNVFSSSFSAFLSRAHDQLRMAALSNANFTVVGSHAGVSIGKDGASQMGLEDIAMFRSLIDSNVFYPSDSVSTLKLTYLSKKMKGISYIRTTRDKIATIYDNDEKFVVGDFKVLKQSSKDKVVLVGAGITLHECLKAYNDLGNVAVIDCYSIKPFNGDKFRKFVSKHGNKVVVVEDHYKEGGIGEMIASELVNTEIKLKHLCVKEIPHSGSKDQLLKKYEIDSEAIMKAVKDLNR